MRCFPWTPRRFGVNFPFASSQDHRAVTDGFRSSASQGRVHVDRPPHTTRRLRLCAELRTELGPGAGGRRGLELDRPTGSYSTVGARQDIGPLAGAAAERASTSRAAPDCTGARQSCSVQGRPGNLGEGDTAGRTDSGRTAPGRDPPCGGTLDRATRGRGGGQRRESRPRCTTQRCRACGTEAAFE